MLSNFDLKVKLYTNRSLIGNKTKKEIQLKNWISLLIGKGYLTWFANSF